MRRHIVGLQLGIETGIHFHGGVTGHQSGIQLMVPERGGKIISCQAIGSVMHFIHRSFHVEMRFGSKEIESFTVGMKAHGHLIERIFRQKLVNIEVIDH